MPNAIEFGIERVDHGHAAQRAEVLALLGEHLVASSADVERRYRWLYVGNPCGRAVTYVARSAAGEAMGLTSLFPRRVRAGGVDLTGAIGGDGFVRPRFRRMGVVTRLHRAAIEGMARGPVTFMYGPPEPHNLRGLLRAGAVVVGAASVYARALGAAAFARLPARLAPLVDRALRAPAARCRLHPLGDQVDPRVDALWAELAERRRSDVLPVRDGAFYAWRFARSPSAMARGFLVVDGERPVGAVVIERRGDRAALHDLMALPGALSRVLAAALDGCRGAAVVTMCLHTPATMLELALLAHRFVPRQRKPFQVQTPAAHPQRALLTAPRRWMYTWADGDVDQVL